VRNKATWHFQCDLKTEKDQPCLANIEDVISSNYKEIYIYYLGGIHITILG
jgi:hypothetical protein